VGLQEIAKLKLQAEKAIRRGIPDSFVHIIERYGMGDCSFHRPKEVWRDSEALSPEMGLFLSESLGLELEQCSDPSRYADYLAGKASQGLSEKMWVEDWESPELHGLFLPEEFFIGGNIDRKACERLFGRALDPDLMWLFARIDEEYPLTVSDAD
jgi:hypothetical protein